MCERQVVGVRHYWRPDRDSQHDQRHLTAFGGDAPGGYALHVGVLAAGDSALIEINDGFGPRADGLEPDGYLAVLGARWWQLLGGTRGDE